MFLISFLNDLLNLDDKIVALDKDKQFSYQQDLKARWDNQACLDYAEETGMEKGEKKAKIKIAKNLLLAKMDIKFICETTGLDQKTIEGLK